MKKLITKRYTRMKMLLETQMILNLHSKEIPMWLNSDGKITESRSKNCIKMSWYLRAKSNEIS